MPQSSRGCGPAGERGGDPAGGGQDRLRYHGGGGAVMALEGLRLAGEPPGDSAGACEGSWRGHVAPSAADGANAGEIWGSD